MEDNCSDFKSESQDFLKALNTTETALLITCGILVLIDIIIFIDNVLFLWRKHSVNQIKSAVATATWLVALCPILAFISFVSMLIPNAFLFREVLATGCISVVMYKFVELASAFIRHYGGLRERIKETQKLRFDVPPLACCCKCLPTAQIKRHRVLILKALVLQFPLVTMPISMLTMYLWVDNKYRMGEYTASNPWAYLTSVKVASTLTAMYGLGVLYAMVREPLKLTYISQKYMAFKLCALIYNVQHLIFRILSSNDVFTDRGCFPKRVMGDFYENTAFNFELFAISLFNLWAYRRPFAEEPSIDLGESNFDLDIYDNDLKVKDRTGAVFNAGFEGDPRGVDKKMEIGDDDRSVPSAEIISDATSPSVAANKLGTTMPVVNPTHGQNVNNDGDGTNGEIYRSCPRCGHDLHF